jgi:hypothetical protein
VLRPASLIRQLSATKRIGIEKKKGCKKLQSSVIVWMLERKYCSSIRRIGIGRNKKKLAF